MLSRLAEHSLARRDSKENLSEISSLWYLSICVEARRFGKVFAKKQA
jgi:hypothetical protein